MSDEVTTHRYGGLPDQVADLRVPTGDGPHPVAMIIHGGFWRARYTREIMEGLACDLSLAGWATWNVEYRRVGAGGGVPQTLDDVLAAHDAVATLRAPLDVRRIAVLGHSAGGHLAFWLASRRRLQLAVSLAGVVCLAEAARQRLGDGAVSAFCGGGPEDVPRVYERADPSAHLPLGVPQLVVHGDADDVVPVEMSRTWAERAATTGDACELMVLRGVGHFELIDPRAPAWASVRARLPRAAA